MKKIIISVLILFLIFGSNNYKELNNLAIISNIGITKNKNSYHLVFQEINPEKQENKIKYNYKYYSSKCDDLHICFRDVEELIPKKIYLNHLQNIIINTDNKNIIYKLNKYLDNDLDNFNILYTTNNVESIMKYNNSYKYVNSVIKDNISYREIRKNKLEKKLSKIPVVKIENNNLIFYKYLELGDKDE